MNIWQLKKEMYSVPPSKMTRAKIDKIEVYCRELHRATWNKKNRGGQFKRLCESVVKFLDKPLVVSLHSSVGFLILEKNAIKIYLDEHQWIWQDKELIGLLPNEHYFIIEGKTYHHNCCETYYRTNGSSFIEVMTLRWKLPEVQTCESCGRPILKSLLAHNEILDGLVDSICGRMLANHKNPTINLRDPIKQYHSHKLNWKYIPRKLNGESTPYFGVEIEVQSRLGNDQYHAQEAALNIATNNGLDPDMYFEWDGSLSGGGFEIITNPMTLDFHQRYWAKHLPIIRKYCGGYDAEKLLGLPEDNNLTYGIHLTVHRKFVPNTVIMKLARFFDFKENAMFLYCIAQRNKMYGGYYLGDKAKPKISDTLTVTNKGEKLASKDRRFPINLKSDNLAEFRMFRSTLNTVSFLKNLEFLEAIILYFVQQKGNDLSYKSFLKWLCQPENAKRYQNLVMYLKHPMFFVKGVGKVKNEWEKEMALFLKNTKKKRDPLAEFGPIITVDEFDISERSTL